MFSPSSAPAPPSLGLAVFDSLRAEDEAWLDQCFVRPDGFHHLISPRSLIVFGAAGAGKTTLKRMLIHDSQGPAGQPTRLIVEWRPTPPAPGVLADYSFVQEQIKHVYDACAWSLLQHLAASPTAWANSGDLTRATLVWFVHRYLLGNPLLRARRLVEGATTPGTEAVRAVVTATPEEVIYRDAAPTLVIAELAQALTDIGLQGIWVMVDGLEAWVDTGAETMSEGLRAFLSALHHFECPALAYKLFIPSRFEKPLIAAGGIQRQRFDSLRLDWEADFLQRVVERRLALALDEPEFPLARLCDSPDLIRWLGRAGGGSAREWLAQVRPLVSHYLARHLTRPIPHPVWRKLRRQARPRLYVQTGRQVIVGGRPIPLDDIPASAYPLLEFLFQQSGRVCTKAELYYLAHRGLKRIPAVTEQDYEPPAQYEGVIDTAIWRLRKALEPDPKDPVLIITLKGHGIRLDNTW